MVFQSISNGEVEALLNVFSEEEVKKKEVWDFDSFKSPIQMMLVLIF